MTEEEASLTSRSGREAGSQWFKSAVGESRTEEQVQCNLLFLQAACIHFLATCIFNKELSDGTPDNFCSKRVGDLIGTDVATFREEYKAGHLVSVRGKAPVKPPELVK